MYRDLLHTITETKLPNGLKILSLQKRDTPVISVQVWYKVGSSNERESIRGISHILEHMMFRGSNSVKSEEHVQRINDVGGHCNAFTTEDITAYVNSVPKVHLSMVLALEADRMKNLTIDKKIFETEQKVIIEEYHTYMNNPVAKSFLEFRSILFNNHPYQVNPLGILEDIQQMNAEDLSSYYRTWYSPSNAILVIAGDFENTENLIDMVSHYFGSMQKSDIVPEQDRQRVIPRSSNSIWMKRKVDFDVPLLLVGYPGPNSAHEDAIPLDILQIILSQGETSRLFRSLVRDTMYAVMAGGMNHFLKFGGMSLFFAAFTPDTDFKKVEEVLNSQIDHIIKHGIDDIEIEKVKNSTLTTRTFDLFSAEHICQRIGSAETIDGDYRILVKKMEALENIDRVKILEVMKKYWYPEMRHTLLLVPKKFNLMLYSVGKLRKIFGKRGD